MHTRKTNVTFSTIAALAAVMLAVAASRSDARTMQRRVQELISAQTTNIVCWYEPDNGNTVCEDYAGTINAANNLNLGTITDGTITEQPGPTPGTSALHIVLHTADALTWGTQPAPGLVFGHTAGQVLAGADAALGDSLFTVDMVNNVPPGSPLPNLAQVFFAPQPGQVVNKVSYVLTADGTLRAAFGVPDGTPGMAHTTQRGLFTVPGQGIPPDRYPTERVIFQALGQ